jgi:hypothetical protein
MSRALQRGDEPGGVAQDSGAALLVRVPIRIVIAITYSTGVVRPKMKQASGASGGRRKVGR